MKRTFSGLMVILLCMGMLAMAVKIQSVRASGTITINADGSVDPRTAPISTTNNVTYTLTDNITVDTGITGIVVMRTNIVIDGNCFTLQGSVTGKGIDLSGRENVTVRNIQIKAFICGIWLDSNNNSVNGNNITDNSCGIELYYSSSNNVVGNNITNNGVGIWLEGSSNNSVVGNNITNNNDDGIGLDNSHDNIISGNNITNNYWGSMLVFSSNNVVTGNTFTGDGLYVWSSYLNSVENNTVNGRPLVYLEAVADYNVHDAGQVILVRCDGIKLENLNLSRTSIGVQLLETNNAIISGNIITADNVYGIWLDSSSSNTVSGNNVTNIWTGISLGSSSNSNSISGNNITNNGVGIWLESSSNNSVIGNNIMANSIYGIGLHFSSSNSLSRNNIAGNSEGIYVGGLSNNKLCHNNFIDNGVQVYTEASTNVWDEGYPSGGNYWSDYGGNDYYGGTYQNETGSDGIGDTPYVVDANNTDNYPLMSTWTPLVGDLNRDGKVSLQDLQLLANAYHSKPGNPNWNPLADIAPPYGIVSLTDLVTLAMHYGQHSP